MYMASAPMEFSDVSGCVIFEAISVLFSFKDTF